jgi:hypothetical protein
MTLVLQTPQLTSRALVLAKIEDAVTMAAGGDALPSPLTDAILVGVPEVKPEVDLLQRTFARLSLSPVASSIGRKRTSVTFSADLKASGDRTVAPALDPLLRACGYARTSVPNSPSSGIVVSPAFASGPNGLSTAAGTITWTKGGNNRRTGKYRLTVILGGAPGTAKVRVTGTPAFGDDTCLPSDDISTSFLALERTATGGANGVQSSTRLGVTTPGTNTDRSSVTYTVAGTITAGDILTLIYCGKRFPYTVKVTDTTTSLVAQGIINMINAVGGAASYYGLVATATTLPSFTVASPTSQSYTSSAITTASTGTTTIPLVGSGGATLAMSTFSGTLSVGDAWDITISEYGIHYTPVSDNLETCTLYCYYEQVLHKITGCAGTVSFSGQGGAYTQANFTFSGNYIAPVDAALPTNAVFEKSVPVQTELAQATLGGTDDFCLSSFTVDFSNTVTPRTCLNRADAYAGFRITNRAPVITLDPEAMPEAKFALWEYMTLGTLFSFHVRVGTLMGNIVRFQSDNLQISDISYADRDGLRAYTVNLAAVTTTANGNDELRVIFG